MSTHNVQFRDKIRNFPKYLFSCAIRSISWGLKNEFELVMVNEPSVIELLRFDCICNLELHQN